MSSLHVLRGGAKDFRFTIHCGMPEIPKRHLQSPTRTDRRRISCGRQVEQQDPLRACGGLAELLLVSQPRPPQKDT